jgi:hypothetical protein
MGVQLVTFLESKLLTVGLFSVILAFREPCRTGIRPRDNKAGQKGGSVRSAKPGVEINPSAP